MPHAVQVKLIILFRRINIINIWIIIYISTIKFNSFNIKINLLYYKNLTLIYFFLLGY